jgi:uncharacterized repeat protein (TIGR01451 family)
VFEGLRIRSRRGRSRGIVLITALLAAGLALMSAASPARADATITSSGPLTSVRITPQLNCDIRHTGDSSAEFFGQTACGTFLNIGTALYGPASVPAGGSATGASGYVPWTAVSQTGPTGTGTPGDPFKVITVVTAGAGGPTVTETDTYIAGQEAYRTDVTVANATAAPVDGRLYRAGDCFLQNSDSGFGRVDGAAVACTADATPGTRIEQWFPLSAGSHYFEAGFSAVWAKIGAKLPFPDTCQCAIHQDNGAGLSWDFTVPAGGAITKSHLTSFSPTGVQPLTTTKTADAGRATAGAADGYTITIHNPNTGAASVNSITDTLPAGFTYTTGSTTQATTADPTIAGQDLTWAGPFTAPPGGDLTLHFGVTVASSAGTYYNNAGGTSDSVAIAATGDTAPVVVGEGGGTEPTPTQTTLVSSANPSNPSSPATFTATVGPPGCGGAIIFSSDGQVIGTPDTDANGAASITPDLPGGTHLIQARYPGNSDCLGSQAELTQVVTRRPTITRLSTSANPAAVSQPPTVTATVGPRSGTGVPTGSVAFQHGADSLGTATLDSHGQAQLVLPPLAVGDYEISATYSGDPTFEPSSAGYVQHIVTVATQITADPAILEAGPRVAVFFPNLTAHLSVGTTPLAGKTVVFSLPNGGTICTGTTDSHGTATCAGAVQALLALQLGYVATFQGDATYGASSARGPLVRVLTAGIR